MVDIATREVEDREPTPEKRCKDPAAVALGRKGGMKGGKARAAKLDAGLVGFSVAVGLLRGTARPLQIPAERLNSPRQH